MTFSVRGLIARVPHRDKIAILLKLSCIVVGLTFVGLLMAVVLYKWAPVERTLFMKDQAEKVGAAKIEQTWVPIEQISPELARAVMAAEDNRFPSHNGFEWDAIKRAYQMNKKGKSVHGASTISQQTAKNVFLWNGRSWIRKGTEVLVTVMIEVIWGKERIMEVYLNVVEQGKGVFGAEASARKFFKKSAKKLTRHEAALMAVVLPNPIKMRIDKPSEYVYKRQAQIVALMPKLGKIELK
ncbi:MAG: monofunctional biosynthetic peptidoglycan transglycosylase [Bacteroidales bacterium]|nr:monofunctional biosynthetic peptidoglycan transglycosylase [Bacteroidales bacterium]